ncbi:hypothetical protein C364_02632 [Cryptococcus neoformans Bt63]|nr:hypothetical protein C364_02632 [Cryptococcus neoformans var. grubii Bt63]
MLRTSRLIPLKKEDDSVHPIAVSELIYRLCAKALIAAHFRPDFLLPFQLGVKSPGGVEPIVKLTEGSGGHCRPLLLLGNLGLIPTTEEPSPAITQRTRCAELWDTQPETILQNLNDIQLKRLTENASKLGRNRLSTIPFNQSLRLSDTGAKGAVVGIEPPTLTGLRRNDLRVRGTSSLTFTDYDLKVYSLGDQGSRSTAVPAPPMSSPPTCALIGVWDG